MLVRIGYWFGVGTLVCTILSADPIKHPLESYRGVEDIDAMAAELRRSLAEQESHSFSRGWWIWDRLRCRYVDGGRQDRNAVKILLAAFRGLILDRHERLEAKGEGHLLYLFHTTLDGDKRERFLAVGTKTLRRDIHGGGYHGGWGGAARMRIYEELVRQSALSEAEQSRFRQIVYQSLSTVFIDFERKAQTANNHSFGNAGGIALAIKLFPESPQVAEARAWLDRIWGDLAAFQDWKEWNYYPYGPIFLHGMLDIAEATGRIDSEAHLINAIGARCLGFVHGGGVRGNPNSGAMVRRDRTLLYDAPWDHGYFAIEQSARDAHFWYRMAQHFRDPEYLWAAEQVSLGGRPDDGMMPEEYKRAYKSRFQWFVERSIRPRPPARDSSIGHLSGGKYRLPERLYLRSRAGVGRPFAAYFLYDKKDEHLDNVSGHLYEYSVDGFKFLHTSGKYNNVYNGQTLRGGGVGEESLDLLLVIHRRHEFPHHPDRQGDQRDFMRRGSIKHIPALAQAENSDAGDAYGQFGFDHYYGQGSRWIRRSVLTREGVLVVADRYFGGEALADINILPVRCGIWA